MPIFPTLPERVARLSQPATAITVSTEPVARDVRKVLRAVYIRYSANVSIDVVITLNSGISSEYDTVLATVPLVAQQSVVFVPDEDLPLAEGDIIDVLAPSGGGVIIAGVQILLDLEYPSQDGEGGFQYEQSRGV